MSNHPNPTTAVVAADILDGISRNSKSPNGRGLSTEEALAYAQVEATLAVAEGQVTANLIAYLAIAQARGARDDATHELDAQICTRLGLTDTEATR